MSVEIKQLRHVSKQLRGLYDRGVKAAEQKNYKYAIDMFREVLKREPGLLDVREQLRQAQLAKVGGEGNLGSQILATLYAIPCMCKMVLLLKKEHYAEALDLGESAMAIDPTAVACCNLVWRAADAADVAAVAISVLEFAHEHHPKSVAVLDKLDRTYSNAGRGKKSLECVVKICGLQPNNKRWQERLKEATAEAAMDDGGWTAAERGEGDYRDLIRDKEASAAMEQEGKTYLDKDDVSTQIERQLAMVRREESVDNLRRLAELYQKAEQYEEALATYDRVIAAMGTPDPGVEQAVTQILGKQFDLALKEWHDYLADDGLSEEERQNGEAQLEAINNQRLDVLIGRYEERIRRYPNAAKERFELAQMQLTRGSTDDALVNFQVCQKNPQFRQHATLYMGRCFEAKGQHDMAIGQLSNALEAMSQMNSVKKETLYDLGRCYEAIGNSEEAARCFKDIYAVDVGFKDVGEIVERLYREEQGRA